MIGLGPRDHSDLAGRGSIERKKTLSNKTRSKHRTGIGNIGRNSTK